MIEFLTLPLSTGNLVAFLTGIAASDLANRVHHSVEFDGYTADSFAKAIPLLCRLYNMSQKHDFGFKVQHPILSSLHSIAMKDAEGLGEKQDLVPHYIKSFGSGAISPQEWIARLEREFNLKQMQESPVEALIKFLQKNIS